MSDEGAVQRHARVLSLPLERVGARPEFFAGTAASWREMWQRRDLIKQLTQREIRAKYKNSSLGLAWSLFKPLAQLLIYYFAIGQVLQKNRPRTIAAVGGEIDDQLHAVPVGARIGAR